MKKALLAAAALTLASGAAFASQARMNALGGAAHIYDTTSIYGNPSDMHYVGDFVEVEFGAQEALFVKTMGDYKLGVSLNHKSEFTHTAMTTFGFVGQQDPFQVFYGAKSGDMNWAASFGYSNVDGKDAGQKATAMGVTFGAATESWDAYAKLGLGSSAEGSTDLDPGAGTTADADAKYKGTTGMEIGGGMKAESIYYFASYGMDGYKLEEAGAFDHEMAATSMTLGMTNTTKADGVEFFYGVSYEMTEMNNKTASNKETETAIPFLVGFEADAASWLTLRGSVKQNLPFGSESKNSTTSNGNLGSSNTIAGGAGLKFGKATLDMELTMANAPGDVNTTSFGTNAALSYMF